MWSHESVWGAIDALARRNGLSASALARRAGLDPTALNLSKRRAGDGRPRWPSTESIGKLLDATGATIGEFLGLMPDARQAPTMLRAALAPMTVPLLGLAQAGAGGYFDDAGFPVGGGWDEIPSPLGAVEGRFALQVAGDSMLPLYRDGDIVIVAPDMVVRKGDRVVVRTLTGEVMAKVLKRRTARIVEVTSLNPEHPDRAIPAGEIDWIARIIWASQ